METLNQKERLIQLEHEIAKQEPIASAEKAFARANSVLPNPFAGAADKLQELILSKEDLELEIRGRQLHELLAKKQDLENRFNSLTEERRVLDRAVADWNLNPTIQRYKAAPGVCQLHGWGRSFVSFAAFIESHRTTQTCYESDWFFLRDPKAQEVGVCFSIEDDRPVILQWREAIQQANRALEEWNNVGAEIRNLLREHPELGAVA